MRIVPTTYELFNVCSFMINGLIFLYYNKMIIQNWNMSQELRQIISTNIKKLRMQNGLNKEKLALILGLDNSYISKLENCKINISIERLEQIALFFNVDIIELLRK